MQNLNKKNILIKPDLNLKQRLLNLFGGQKGRNLYFIDMPNVKTGEIVKNLRFRC